MNSKRLWKDMLLVTMISWYSFINGFVSMVRRLPLIGSLLGEHYRFAVFKKVSRALSPLVMVIVELLKTAVVSALCLAASTFILSVLRGWIFGSAPYASNLSPAAYLAETGSFVVVYLLTSWGTSRVVSEGNTLYGWQRYFHLDMHRSVVLLSIVEPLKHFLSRCVIWSVLFCVLSSAWSILDAVGWSLAVLVLEWAFAKHNYEKKLRVHKTESTGRQLASVALRLILTALVFAMLCKWNVMPTFFGWVISAVLAYPALRSVRYFLQETDFARLMEVSGDMHYSLADLSDAKGNDVRIKDEDLKNSGAPEASVTKASIVKPGASATSDASVASTGSVATGALVASAASDTASVPSASFKGKTGYAYLNAMFFARHKRIIERPIWIRTGIGLAFGLALTCISMFFAGKVQLGESPAFLVYYLPTFMYLLCSYSRLTKAMYVNCDQSLLHYSFYKEKKALLEMFRLRMVSLWKLMALPTLLVLVLVFVNGLILKFSTKLLIAALLLTLANGGFFTIYPLFIYYVFQPYDSAGTITSFAPSFLNALVYMFCFFGAPRLDDAFSPMTFSLLSIGFFALFLPFALFLIRIRGPKVMRKE
ncbi:hypothetical protein [Murdochiella massiliensis]|uniref:hypothetical protein n=1 Tax=Murdochiella massiliensis TaxID=1673723 RepID=UPI0008370DF2|nr:hypothetical protein [Murdochiella massiliensis]